MTPFLKSLNWLHPPPHCVAIIDKASVYSRGGTNKKGTEVAILYVLADARQQKTWSSIHYSFLRSVSLSILSGRKTQEIEEIPIKLKNEGIFSVLYGVSDKIPNTSDTMTLFLT